MVISIANASTWKQITGSVKIKHEVSFIYSNDATEWSKTSVSTDEWCTGIHNVLQGKQGTWKHKLHKFVIK